MNKDIYSVEQIKQILQPIFTGYDVKSAVLFGSYGKGMPTSDSDIDLLVDSRLKGLGFVGFLEDVCRAMDKEVDMFDISHIDAGSEIDREIRETGIIIYEK